MYGTASLVILLISLPFETLRKETFILLGMKPKVCTFGSLYSALMEEKMVSVAKHMATMLAHGTLQLHADQLS